MKRIAMISSNLYLSFQEGKDVPIPEAEIVIMVVEPDYAMGLAPPLVEGGQPQQQVRKFLKPETFRFAATIDGIENMIESFNAIIEKFRTIAEDPDDVSQPKSYIYTGGNTP